MIVSIYRSKIGMFTEALQGMVGISSRKSEYEIL